MTGAPDALYVYSQACSPFWKHEREGTTFSPAVARRRGKRRGIKMARKAPGRRVVWIERVRGDLPRLCPASTCLLQGRPCHRWPPPRCSERREVGRRCNHVRVMVLRHLRCWTQLRPVFGRGRRLLWLRGGGRMRMRKRPEPRHLVCDFRAARLGGEGNALAREERQQLVHLHRHPHGAEVPERLALAAPLALLLVLANAGLAALFAAAGLELAVFALAQRGAAAVLALAALATVLADGRAAAFFTVALAAVVLADGPPATLAAQPLLAVVLALAAVLRGRRLERWRQRYAPPSRSRPSRRRHACRFEFSRNSEKCHCNNTGFWERSCVRGRASSCESGEGEQREEALGRARRAA